MIRLFILTILAPWSFCLALSPGFSFQPGFSASVIHFTFYQNLVIVPVIINDTMKVNLVLDTGGRSIVLFGKRFSNLLFGNISFGKQVRGYKGAVENAAFSYPHSVDIGSMHGEGLGLCVVATRQLFSAAPLIDGWIGYDLFLRHFVEINYKDKTLTLSQKLDDEYLSEFELIKMDEDDTKPYVQSTLILNKKNVQQPKLLIDTGSSFDLILFANQEQKDLLSNAGDVAAGIGGNIRGDFLFCRELVMGTMRIPHPQTSLMENGTLEGGGSVGGKFLRKFTIIFDHASKRIFLKRHGKERPARRRTNQNQFQNKFHPNPPVITYRSWSNISEMAEI